jgi:hypothetical protein
MVICGMGCAEWCMWRVWLHYKSAVADMGCARNGFLF